MRATLAKTSAAALARLASASVSPSSSDASEAGSSRYVSSALAEVFNSNIASIL